MTQFSSKSLQEACRILSKKHGFEVSGIASISLKKEHLLYLSWIDKGYAGKMDYLKKNSDLRSNLKKLWPDTKSALVVGMQYKSNEKKANDLSKTKGKIAEYARGGDYHKFIKKRLLRVLKDLKKIDQTIEGRSFVDTAPILERDLAVKAGLGWKGKNSLLLNRDLGSYFFLGVLLLNKEITNPNIFEENHCGTCNECMEECPTKAIVAPEIIDARRCISYLTIELRGPIPRDLRSMMGNHIFGCDICQTVCPWNEKAPETQQNRFLPRSVTENTNLEELVQLDEKSFREKFQGTAILRAQYDGFLRNVLIAIGNSHKKEYLDILTKTLRHHRPIIRGHSAWAIAEIVKKENEDWARFSLEERLSVEKDEWVIEEIELSLGEISKKNKMSFEAENI
ncbi:MAG: tRNA epoxyqueuosine(34) reductase QueG [Nitrospinota bacterium]|nr:tRNA epoxyqueuosine(34) reductase QueG [Nitrospinota bacterium]